MSELLPCPFCGEVPALNVALWNKTRGGELWYARAACEAFNCFINPRGRTVDGDTRDETVAMAVWEWNHRAPANRPANSANREAETQRFQHVSGTGGDPGRT